MNQITQTREIPVTASCDVVVCGGGPGGWIAAVAAARMGARTALIERNGFAGGMATAGLVVPISVFVYSGELVCGGIPWEFVQRMVDLGGAQVEKPLGNVAHDPEIYKLAAQRMLLESGVHLHYHSVLTGCRQEGGHLTHVIVDTKSGPQAIEARYVIDSTGDGDLCAMMGVPMQENTLPLQPASLCFCLGGVDTDRLEHIHHDTQGVNMQDEGMQKVLRELERAGKIPTFGGPWFCHLLRDGSVIVNMTRMEADMTDPLQATEVECKLREDVHTFTALLREHFPAFKNARLLYTAQQAGVRETRHVRGVHVLTGEEYLSAVHFPDAVARSAHPIDIHSGGDSQQRCTFLEKAAYIPYRSLIIPGFDNLLVASRCFSGDQIASASVRVQAPVMCLGQAAGAAAAQCAKAGASVHDADVPALQETLRSWGAAI